MNFTFWLFLFFSILNIFLFFKILSFLFVNFLSPFSFSLHKIDALIFRHKAILLDEGGEEEKTAGTLIYFSGLLGRFEVLFGLLPEKDGLGQVLLTFCFSL